MILVWIITIAGKRFPFLPPGLTKTKNFRHRKSVLQHDYISKLLTLKADAQYLLRKFRKKIGLEQTFKQNSKATQTTRSQDCNSIIYFISTKQNHINSGAFLFCFQKLILWFKKSLDTDIYLLDIAGTIWPVWKKFKGPNLL